MVFNRNERVSSKNNVFAPHTHFVAPTTISEALLRLQTVREELQKIRTQLSDSDRQQKLGWDNETYREWRHKAIHARNVKSSQQIRIQQWLHDQRTQRAVASLRTNDPIVLLGRMVDIIEDIGKSDDILLSNDEMDIIALAKTIVNENPSSVVNV
jgi:hypothetical protein